MVKQRDELSLKQDPAGYRRGTDTHATEQERLLVGFSLLIRLMADNMMRILGQTHALWEIDPTADELKEKFHTLEQCLGQLKRYCAGKIEEKHT
jgi:hypothetical protein